jgi:hypothetical protein
VVGRSLPFSLSAPAAAEHGVESEVAAVEATPMAGPWLYPLSAAADRTFTLDETGESISVTADSYRALVEDGRIVQDRHWYISQNWNNIEIGDELFIYTGDRDLGIIGCASVGGVEQRGDHWCILPRFDLERCRALLDNPVPAAVVREWVAFPRKSVINLAPFKEQLHAALPWSSPLSSGSTQGSGPTNPILFARIGVMTFYAGSQPGDEKPIGGGAYNRDNLGHERYNFADIGGRLYGYFQPGAGGRTLNLERIKAGATEFADDVLVVFVADQTVVGWYKGARVYAAPRPPSPYLAARRDGCEYYCEAPTDNCVLLPTAARNLQIPRGAGGMGQSNVTYSLNEAGRSKNVPWIGQVLDFIRTYAGPNLLSEQLEEADSELEQAIQRTFAAARGQRYVSDPAARKAVEDYAVQIAIAHFSAQRYEIEKRGKPFDLKCSKVSQSLFVEVKGSQTPCEEVALTPNEVQFACDHHQEMALFVVHAIELNGSHGKYTAHGGIALLFHPWSPEAENLKPAAFVYRLPSGGQVL